MPVVFLTFAVLAQGGGGSRQTPPNNRRHSPALTRLLRDHTADGDIEKNPGPEDAQTTGNDIPPQHREMVTRLASEIETASNPHYPAKLYKYATQALTEALQRKRRASTPPLGHSTPAPRAESSSTHGTLEVPSPEASPVHGVQDPGTPRPTPFETSELTVKTQQHHSPLGLNMTTAIDVVCPPCNMADFVYFRCTTCKYFAIHQSDTSDLVPRRLYNVMSLDPLYPRQESWQEAIPATTSQTYHTPVPHKTGPRLTVEDTPDGWIRDVTSDRDVEPNPGSSPSTPSAKRTRYNQETPHTYQTPRMLRKRTADNTPPGQKRRRTDHVHMANQEHQSPTLVYNHHKRKADGEPTHQPIPKRHQSTTHWDEQHPPPGTKETYTRNGHMKTPLTKSWVTHHAGRSAEQSAYTIAPTRDQRAGFMTRLRTETRSPTPDQPHPQRNVQPRPHHRGTWGLRSTTLCYRSCWRHHHPASPTTTCTNTRGTQMTVDGP